MPQENESGQEKTEAPTGRRRTKAREKGSVCRSKEINSAVMLFFAMCVFALYGPSLVRQLLASIRYAFLHFHEIDLSAGGFHYYATNRLWFVFRLVFPIFFVFLFVGVVANIAQFGWLYTKSTIFQGFKGGNFNPTKMLKKVFNVNNYVIMVFDIVKLFALGVVSYSTFKHELLYFPALIELPLSESLRYMMIMLFKLAMKIIAVLIIIAAIDFIYQKFKHEKSLKMTKQEIKDEMKMIDGDPKVKAQIRSAQRKMIVATMIKNVPDADVVITNPFHIAVAVKYDSKTMDAPLVIAKGARLIAEKIKTIARMASVPIVENKPIARTLYKTINVGEEIPPKLYQAIAEILAYVYQLNKDRARQFSPKVGY